MVIANRWGTGTCVVCERVYEKRSHNQAACSLVCARVTRERLRPRKPGPLAHAIYAAHLAGEPLRAIAERLSVPLSRVRFAVARLAALERERGQAAVRGGVEGGRGRLAQVAAVVTSTANRPAAERLAQALRASGIPLDAETGAGMLAIGTMLLRMSGLSLADAQQLCAKFYAVAPDVARAAVEGDDL